MFKLKYTLKLILLYAIGYFIISLIFDVFDFSPAETLKEQIFTSVFFGIFMGGIFSFLAFSQLSELGLSDEKLKTINISHDKTIACSRSLDEVQEIVESLPIFSNAKIKLKDDIVVIRPEHEFYRLGNTILLSKNSNQELNIHFKKKQIRSLFLNAMNYKNGLEIENAVKDLNI